MIALEQTKNERQYYIDWLRVILILSVFLFHIGMIFNSWDWHVKNEATFEYKSVLWYIMVFLGGWRMPLLILISGAGAYYAVRKRKPGEYLIERIKRLLLPLTFGIFTLVPVQVYIERYDKYESLFSYYPHMFEGVYPTGNFSWHHLWFIAYLFFISLVFIPLLQFYRKGKMERFSNWIEKLTSQWYGANIFVIPLIISQFILRPYFPENTHDFANDWAAMTCYVMFFFVGFLIMTKPGIVSNFSKFRYHYLAITAIATLAMFTIPYMVKTEFWGHRLWEMFETILAWSCSVSVLGFAKKHLNSNKPILKTANQGIYPFYLIHQPVIVVMAFIIVQWEITMLSKCLLITCISFAATIAIYLIVVKPFNLTRVLFGMKPKTRTKNKTQLVNVKPALIQVRNK